VSTKVISVVALICVLLLCACKATPPGTFETSVVSSAKHKLFVGNRKGKNPLTPTAENIAQGKENFAHYCVACHGLDGQNTGVPFADRMSPPVPVLASASTQSYTDGQLKWIIDNGIFPSGMPASKGILNGDEIWSIVLYIRHLPPAGSLGEPAMYSDASECPGNRDAATATTPAIALKTQNSRSSR
jgi:S-disulfanyl-L-cysteine oxidoreductase SoxD